MSQTEPQACAATVLLPTHADRAPVLRYSIPSVLTQTEPDLELFVIGDGVDDATRAVVEGFADQDPRVRFVDKPKHRRRGEPYRHEILQRARGRIVCYLCDRDIMLPEHVAFMSALLTDADFAHSARVAIQPDDTLLVGRIRDLATRKGRLQIHDGRLPEIHDGIPLACAAHTREAYFRLTDGWQTTPEGLLTDNSMWWKFLRRQDCRAVSDNERVTILYFPRYPKTAWPTQRRAADLARWHARMQEPGWRERFDADVSAAIRDFDAAAPGPKVVGPVSRKRLKWTLFKIHARHRLRQLRA